MARQPEEELDGDGFVFLQVPGSHFEGDHSPLHQDQAGESSVPAGRLPPRGSLRLRQGGRLLLRPQPRGAQGLDVTAAAR